jgi:hypothetical protein
MKIINLFFIRTLFIMIYLDVNCQDKPGTTYTHEVVSMTVSGRGAMGRGSEITTIKERTPICPPQMNPPGMSSRVSNPSFASSSSSSSSSRRTDSPGDVFPRTGATGSGFGEQSNFNKPYTPTPIYNPVKSPQPFFYNPPRHDKSPEIYYPNKSNVTNNNTSSRSSSTVTNNNTSSRSSSTEISTKHSHLLNLKGNSFKLTDKLSKSQIVKTSLTDMSSRIISELINLVIPTANASESESEITKTIKKYENLFFIKNSKPENIKHYGIIINKDKFNGRTGEVYMSWFWGNNKSKIYYSDNPEDMSRFYSPEEIEKINNSIVSDKVPDETIARFGPINTIKQYKGTTSCTNSMLQLLYVFCGKENGSINNESIKNPKFDDIRADISLSRRMDIKQDPKTHRVISAKLTSEAKLGDYAKTFQTIGMGVSFDKDPKTNIIENSKIGDFVQLKNGHLAFSSDINDKKVTLLEVNVNPGHWENSALHNDRQVDKTIIVSSFRFADIDDMPYSGLSMQPNPKGVKVMEVDKNSSAEKVGIKEGDIIIKFNGKTVEDFNLPYIIFQTPIGTIASITIIRDGQEQIINNFKIDKLPYK